MPLLPADPPSSSLTRRPAALRQAPDTTDSPRTARMARQPAAPLTLAPALARTVAKVMTLVTAALVAGCASRPAEPPPQARRETLWVVTDAAELLRVQAGRPQQVLQRTPLRGLAGGERLVGIDFRVARGLLYALGSGGRLYTLDTASGQLTPVGAGAPVALDGQHFGVDFNPVADRLRVVSDRGQNLRLHPDTGALAATDPPLSWQASAGTGLPAPRVAGAAYTYNTRQTTLTTNYAMDLDAGWLLTQGSVEGLQPAISPNTGQLMRVGALGTGALEDASFDIADTDNAALAALRRQGRTRLYGIDLASGQATLLGTLAEGRALWGLAIEP